MCMAGFIAICITTCQIESSGLDNIKYFQQVKMEVRNYHVENAIWCLTCLQEISTRAQSRKVNSEHSIRHKLFWEYFRQQCLSLQVTDWGQLAAAEWQRYKWLGFCCSPWDIAPWKKTIIVFNHCPAAWSLAFDSSLNLFLKVKCFGGAQ